MYFAGIAAAVTFGPLMRFMYGDAFAAQRISSHLCQERRVIDDELRRGTGDTVFMICGAGGAAEELAGLAEVLDGDPRVIALVPLPAPDRAEATTVEAMATAAVALMRSHQPDGPYRLLGYSLGGIVALEAGRLLQEAGERVSFLGLVDALFDRRYWPGRLFLRASARRARRARPRVGRQAAAAGLA